MLRPIPNIPDERVARGHIDTFEPRQLCTTLWALAKLGLHSSELYAAAAPLLMRMRRDIGDKGLAELAATYTRPAVQTATNTHRAVLLMVARATAERVQAGSMVPSALGETLWDLWRCQAHSNDGSNGTARLSDDMRLVLRAGVEQRDDATGPQGLLALDAGAAGSMLAEADDQVLQLNVTDAVLADAVRSIVQALADLSESVRRFCKLPLSDRSCSVFATHSACSHGMICIALHDTSALFTRK